MLKCSVKKVKRLLAMMLAVIMTITSVTTPISVQAAEDTDVTSYVNDLILYYRDYQEAAQTDIDRVLAEMRAVDAGKADAWKKIMDYWSEVNSEGFANIGTVPEGLPEDDSVAIVILGFALNSDGTMKDELIGRLQTGLDIANAYPNSYVVVTGGGTAANNPNVTEGGLMGEWLLEQGLDSSRVIVENRAPDTVGNAQYTYEILKTKYPQVQNVVLVTSDYHVPRGCVLYYSKFVLDALSTGQEPLEIVSNAGYNTGTNGYETIALQSRGVASVAGISLSGSVELSQLSSLKIVQNTPYETGNDLDLTVTAEYNTGYSRDVTKLATITGFDPAQSKEQMITVSYTENGITMEGTLTLTDTETTVVATGYLSELIASAETLKSGDYTKASYEAFAKVLESAKNTLNKESLTKEEVESAYNQLKTAVNKLRPRINVAAYYKSFAADSDQAYVMELDGSYQLEELTVDATGAEVLVSEDNVSWTEDYTGTNVKYIKIIGSESLQASQVYAYGEEADNIILGKDMYSSGSDQSASSSAGATDYKAVDGDRSTYWDAGAYSSKPWIIVDLDGTYQLDKINVINYWKNNNRYYHFEVYTSIDGETYSLVGGKDTDDKETIYGNTVDLSDQAVYASYIKVVGTYNSKNSAFHINEIRAYGTPVDRDSAMVSEARRALQSLVNTCEATYAAKDYTEATFAPYNEALNAAKALLEDETSTYEDLRAANTALSASVENLVYAVDDSKAEGTFRVASFNIKSKAYPNTAKIKSDLYTRYAIDIVGMQEVDKETTRNPYDVLASFVDETYAYSSYQKSIDYQGGAYGNGILSNAAIVETAGDQYEVTGSEGRSWQRAIVEIDGKQVAFYNTHFALEYETRAANLAELLAVMENDPTEYKILTGDFNSTWESMYPFLEDYNLANGKGGNWICTTTDEWTGEDTVTDSHAIDNIITTRNIEVTNITVVDPADLSDHRMIYADCKLLDEAVVSTEYLDIVIADADAIDREGIYTEESYAVFAEVLNAAKAVDEAAATQDEVNKMITDLQAAMAQLDRIIDNVALGKEVSGSGTADSLDNVTDGDIFTEWTSETLTDSVVIDLEDIYELDELKVVSTPKQAGTYGVKYEVYAGLDNETFTQVAAKVSDDNVTSKGVTYLFEEPIVARYLKVQFTYATSEEVRLSEVEAYGEVSNSHYKELIQKIIEECSELKKSLYTPETIALLEEALSNAEAILEKKYPVDGEFTDAYEALVFAMDALEARDNIAYKKTVTASHNTSDASRITDGNTTNYWGSVENGVNVPIADASFVIDLYGTYALDAVHVIPYYSGNERYYHYDILVSADNTEWTKVAEQRSTEDTLESGAFFELEETVNVRYIKVQGVAVQVTGRDDINNFHVNEVLAYGTLLEAVDGDDTTEDRVIENLALRGEVTVDSGSKNYTLTDGKIENSYWGSSNGIANAYAIVELPGKSLIDEVKVVTYYNNTSKWYTYEVLISNDKENWESIGTYEEEVNKGKTGYTISLEEPVEAKYVKVQGLNTNNTNFHLVEIEVYGSMEKNIALGKTVTTNGEETDHPGSNIVDGDWTNYWGSVGLDELGVSSKKWADASADNYPYAIIDLGNVYKLDSVNVIPLSYTNRYYQYEIYTSMDGVTYSFLGAKTDTVISCFSKTLYPTEPVNAKYIKVVGTWNSANSAFHLSEVRATGTLVAEEAMADYTAVNAALAKVPEDLTLYTASSALQLKAALLTVKEGLTESSQNVVDGYAAAINSAIDALEYRPADYTSVYEAIAAAEALPKDKYEDLSAVDAAVAAVVEGLDITKQAEVEDFAKAITDAIAALEYKTYTVTFRTGDGFSNQLVAEAACKWGESLTAPESRTYLYYLFEGWDADGDGNVDVKAGGVIEGITEDRIYVAVYALDPSCWYTVSFTEGSQGSIASASTKANADGAYLVDTWVKVSAPETIHDGTEKKFAGWYKGEELVSANLTYGFYLKGDVELTAAYAETEPEAVPAVTFSTLKRIDGYSSNPKKDRATFGITWDAPSGCTVISEGILRVYANSGDISDLVLETENTSVKNQVCSKAGATGSYTVNCTIGNSLENFDLYVRGYVTYRDKTGTVKTVYTNTEVLYASGR